MYVCIAITQGNTVSLIPGQMNCVRVFGIALRFEATGEHKMTYTFSTHFKLRLPQRSRNRIVLNYD